MSAAGRCAAQTPKGAASPPLTFDKAAAPGLGDAPHEGTGPPLRPPGCCASPAATAQRAGLDPGDHCGPSARRYGQAPACPAPWRGASGDPHAHGTYDGRKDTQLNWRSILARSGKITRIRYEEVSTLSGDCRHQEAQFWVFELPDGRHAEIFGSSYRGKEHFATGPVVGFAVRDLPAAVDELRGAGVELLGEPGPTWQHFRGPDGNVYELVTS